MSILSEWMTKKHNARQWLLFVYRDLREVLNSDLLFNEKRHLFETAHRNEIQDRAWLVRPDLYGINSRDFKGPAERRPGVDKEEARLRVYLHELDSMLEYGKHKAELLLAVEAVSAVMEMPFPIEEVNSQKRCEGRLPEFKKHVPRLREALKALRLEPSISVESPFGGYFWADDSHRQWIAALQGCANRA